MARMIGWARRALAPAVAALAFACSPQAPEPAAGQESAAPIGIPAPALWRTADADTTVYLFGTIHVLPPGLDWRTPQLEAAFSESSAVYFETDINPDPAALNRIVTEFGRYPSGQKLTDLLDPAQLALLEQASADVGLPMFVIEGLRPWMAALTIAEQLIVRAGYDPMSGVERTLHPLAVSAGKDIRKLETVDQQLLAFADLPEQVQLDYLMQGLAQIGEEKEMLAELVGAWRSGDVEALDRIMIEGDFKELPEIYAALLVRRNAAWTNHLVSVIAEEPGVFFVAVGAGHLTGEDSVQSMLTARGLVVERVVQQ